VTGAGLGRKQCGWGGRGSGGCAGGADAGLKGRCTLQQNFRWHNFKCLYC